MYPTASLLYNPEIHHQRGPSCALIKKATLWKRYAVMPLKTSIMLMHQELQYNIVQAYLTNTSIYVHIYVYTQNH